MEKAEAIVAPKTAALSARQPVSANMGDVAATEAVRSAVFGTTELFEQILLQVDMKTLLSQHVDSQWRDFITDSPALQKKLFFKPATFREVKEFAQSDEHYGRLFITLTPEYCVWKLTEPAQPTSMINPLLFRAPWLCPAELGLKHSVSGEHASWTKMLYIQPPPLKVAPALQFNVQFTVEGALEHRRSEFVQFTHRSRCELDTYGELLKAMDRRLAVKGHRVDWEHAMLSLSGIAYI